MVSAESHFHRYRQMDADSSTFSHRGATMVLSPSVQRSLQGAQGVPSSGPMTQATNFQALTDTAVASVRSGSSLSDRCLEVQEMRQTSDGKLTILFKRFVSWVLSLVISPGFIQKRSYILTVQPLVDAVTPEELRGLSFTEKAARLQEEIKKMDPKNEIDRHVMNMYKIIGKMTKKGADIYALRQQFFAEMSAAHDSLDYQGNIEGYLALAKASGVEEAKRQYPSIAQLQEMAAATFTQVNLNQFGEESVRAAIQDGGRDPAVDFAQPMDEILRADRDAIEKADSDLKGGTFFAGGSKLRGHLNIDFEPLHANNPCHVLHDSTFVVGREEFTSTCLRFGTPTHERVGGKAEVIPLMRLFLDHCVAHGKRVTSFQHQNAQEKSALKGNEWPRLRAMIKLGEEPRYAGTLFVITLPMDGDFFKQKGAFAKLDDATAFKREFEGQIAGIAGVQRFHFPDGHGVREITDDMHAIIENVHTTFFEGRETLTVEERQVFQMLTYVFMEEYFLARTRPDYYHGQCKDAMDRAMSMKAISYYINLIRTGGDKDPRKLENFRTFVHMAPLMIKGVGMHGERFRLLQQTVKILQGLSESGRASLKEGVVKVRGQPVSCTKVHVKRDPAQSLYVSPRDASSPRAYKEIMQREKELPQFHREFVAEDVEAIPDHISDATAQGELAQLRNFAERFVEQRFAAPGLKPPVTITFKEMGAGIREGEGIRRQTYHFTTSLGHEIVVNVSMECKTKRLLINW
ncbi:MAG: hypothetical protein ACKVOH_01520 [Chlamydiales bacterium]